MNTQVQEENFSDINRLKQDNEDCHQQAIPKFMMQITPTQVSATPGDSIVFTIKLQGLDYTTVCLQEERNLMPDPGLVKIEPSEGRLYRGSSLTMKMTVKTSALATEGDYGVAIKSIAQMSPEHYSTMQWVNIKLR